MADDKLANLERLLQTMQGPMDQTNENLRRALEALMRDGKLSPHGPSTRKDR